MAASRRERHTNDYYGHEPGFDHCANNHQKYFSKVLLCFFYVNSPIEDCYSIRNSEFGSDFIGICHNENGGYFPNR